MWFVRQPASAATTTALFKRIYRTRSGPFFALPINTNSFGQFDYVLTVVDSEALELPKHVLSDDALAILKDVRVPEHHSRGVFFRSPKMVSAQLHSGAGLKCKAHVGARIE